MSEDVRSRLFDPVTYRLEIQPLWAKLTELPDDAEAALEFWMNDEASDRRLTDSGPKGKMEFTKTYPHERGDRSPYSSRIMKQ